MMLYLRALGKYEMCRFGKILRMGMAPISAEIGADLFWDGSAAVVDIGRIP